MADDDSPQNAEFIGRVVTDAKNPPDARLLTGWFGDAGEEGKRRLYTSADLSAYVDLPTDAILHSEPVRDSQPPGAVFVWVRSDAVPPSGGSAASRAARFLQGQVTQDFGGGGGGGCVDLSSPEKAGYRCVTQVPCGEPTGFTGRCTKQPEVGGAWPCITAAPLCVEVTGFTGKCTPLPWPHPTKYIGCTFLHCPTRDLTHIQQICNMVATGMPGCGVIDPGIGGGPVEKQAAGEQEGHGAAAAAGATMIPGCGYTQTWGLCETKLLGCGFTKQWGCQQTQPPKCNASVDIPCIMAPMSNLTVCTQIDCTARQLGANFTPATVCTQVGCPAGEGFGAFGAAAPGLDPSAVDACPTRINCKTQPPTSFCTQPPDCRTCWPDCQTNQPNCTQFNCVTQPKGDCTFFGCPTKGCTQVGPQCPQTQDAVCPSVAAPCPTPDCTITPPICLGAQPAGAQAFAAPAAQPAQAQAFGNVGNVGGNVGRTDAAFGGGCPPFFTQFANQCVLGPVTFELQCPTALCPPTSPPQCPHTVQGCPTSFPNCQHTLVACTVAGPMCPLNVGTVFGPQCPGRQVGPTGFQGCTQFQPQCGAILWTQHCTGVWGCIKPTMQANCWFHG